MQEQGIAILNKAIEACTEEIERHKGKLTVKEAPRAVRITKYKRWDLEYLLFGFQCTLVCGSENCYVHLCTLHQLMFSGSILVINDIFFLSYVFDEYDFVQVSEREDKLLAEHMAKLGRENEEISGDEGSEEEEDTGMGEIDLDNSGTGITE